MHTTRGPRLPPAVATILLLHALPAGADSSDGPAASPPTPPATEARPAAPAASPAADGAKRVLYLPQGVKDELREEIKAEVLAEAQRDRWAAPEAVPAWLRRLRLSGDVLVRLERDLFGAGNAVGEFPDFNAINTSAPTDDQGFNLANDRYLNVDTPRTRPRLRARLGLDAEVTESFTAGLRLASGDTSSPVSTTQTLGSAPGTFGKYQFWLDRAYLRYAPFRGALALEAGRFENPFFATDLIYSENVNFDGLAVKADFPAAAGVAPFLAGGAFPLYTTPLNYPAQSPDQFGSTDKWLYALQVGANVRPGPVVGLKLGAAFYYFNHVEGRLGAPCDTNLSYVTCNTDGTRPSFAQKGNTYLRLRTPSQAALAAESSGASRYEYFGLASRFRELVATGRLEVRVSAGLKFTVDGEFARNAGFSRKEIAPVAVSNCDNLDNGLCARYVGGPNGYLARLGLGSPELKSQWDFSLGLDYRYLESDAVVDAFTNSDFGLGGTNLKGFVLAATVAVADDVLATARWMSADQVSGPPYKSDVFQLDLWARF